MPQAHADALTYLTYAIGALFLIIVGAVLLAVLKKKPEPTKTLEKKEFKSEGEIKASEQNINFSTQDVEKVLTKSAAQALTEVEPETTKLESALANTKKNFFGRIKGLFITDQKNPALEDIEEVLYTSDLGPQTVQRLLGRVEEELSKSEKTNPEALKNVMKQELLSIFEKVEPSVNGDRIFEKLQLSSQAPTVWLIAGVNGAGKTTTIGKLSAHLAQSGKKVLVAAGDTFRAAAGSQLKVWTERAQVEIFSPEGVTDPSAVAFDAVSMAKARAFDVVMIDTAGRLHTQANLMEELKKVKRVIQKVIPEAPHEVLLVLDANSGQNALIQAKEFNSAVGVSGVILTKLDGSAKGGVAVGVACELGLPVKLIGVGEKIHDLREFKASEFVDSIL